MEQIFHTAIFLILFAYFGYPATLVILGRIRPRNVNRSEITPPLTVIVTVHNEEKRIGDKLENTLSLDYPRDKLQILVASDGSEDSTNSIVEEYRDKGVSLVAIEERKGKENAQKVALQHATGDIIVFSDVATMLEKTGLMQLVSNFADPEIGCVSSEDRLLDREGKPSGEGLYLRYEMWLRRVESSVGSLVGLSGSLFAARKEVCEDFSAEMQSDFRTVLNSMKQGLRGISDPMAIGIYQDAGNPKREWDRKIRTILRGLTVFFQHLDLLNIFRYGLFSYQLFCHKFLRWSVPLLLIIVLLSNLLIYYDAPIYMAALIAQVMFYGAAIMGLVNNDLQRNNLVRVPSYFLTVNFAILYAWWCYIRGRRIVTWTPTIR